MRANDLLRLLFGLAVLVGLFVLAINVGRPRDREELRELHGEVPAMNGGN